MIVSCPSCGTLYRTTAHLGTARARCSCCEATVTVASRRSYAVVDASRAETLVSKDELARAPRPYVAERPASGPARSAVPALIGMDDPALAPRLRHTALDAAPGGGGPSPVMTWTLLAEDFAPPSPRARSAPPGALAETESVLGEKEPGAPRGDNMVARDAEGAIRPVLVGVAVGALAGVAGSTWFGGSAVSWWAGGALAGGALVLGLRGSWTSRND